MDSTTTESEMTKQIEVHTTKQGPGRIWAVWVKVDGRQVEWTTYGSKREAMTALITAADKYR